MHQAVKITQPNFTLEFFTHVAYGPSPVLLWRRCDMLCTSGFVDDVTFSYSGTMGQNKARRYV